MKPPKAFILFVIVMVAVFLVIIHTSSEQQSSRKSFCKKHFPAEQVDCYRLHKAYGESK